MVPNCLNSKKSKNEKQKNEECEDKKQKKCFYQYL